MLWLGYGWWMHARSGALRERLMGTPRRRRVLYGSVGLIAAATFLLAGLAGLASLGGISEGGLSLWAWPLTALLGLGFVHMQVMGAAALISLVQEAETTGRGGASQSTGKERP